MAFNMASLVLAPEWCIKLLVDAVDNLLKEPNKGQDLSRFFFCRVIAGREDRYRVAKFTTAVLSSNIAVFIVISESATSSC